MSSDPQLICFNHFFNEELLLPSWIKHHSKIFDHGVLVNHCSTDRSVDICNELMPSGWELINTRLSNFSAEALDEEMMDLESQYDGIKLILNVTEFVFTPNFKQTVLKRWKEFPDTQAFGMRSVCLIDKDENLPLLDPIFKNRTWGYFEFEENSPTVFRNWRTIHNQPKGLYSTGRHSTHLRPFQTVPEWLLLHFTYSPWPDTIPRKLQIQTRIPEWDKVRCLGIQHLTDQKGLESKRSELLKYSYNLLDVPLFKQYYDEIIQ